MRIVKKRKTKGKTKQGYCVTIIIVTILNTYATTTTWYTSTSHSMKPTLTWWGGLSNQEVFTPVHEQEELFGAMWLRPLRTNRSFSCKCQGLDSKWKNLDYSRLLIFCIFSSPVGLWWVDLCGILIYIIFSRSTLYHIVFSPVCYGLEFLSLEVKCDIFRYGDDGTWQKNPN